MNTINNKHCCICLESFEHKPYQAFNFACQICNEGIICTSCLRNLFRQKRWKEIEWFEEIEKCPICRISNYKYHFDIIMDKFLDQVENIDDNDNSALNIARKTLHGEDVYNYLEVQIFEYGLANITNMDSSINIEIRSEEMYNRYLKELVESDEDK